MTGPTQGKQEKWKIPYPIIVEGKYDKITLSTYLDAQIIPTDGFGIYSKAEKAALLRRLAERGKVIVLTDSDGGGVMIRSHLSGILPREKVIHLYIPAIPGKERRKKTPGKAGTLGVEGMSGDTIRRLFAPFRGTDISGRGGITKSDFYADGLSGRPGSESRRDVLAAALLLPPGMTANALLGAVNLLCSREEYQEKIQQLFTSEEDQS